MACKRIELESQNCTVENSQFGFLINNEDINQILKRSCKGGLEIDKKYFASIKIEISVIEEDELLISNNWKEL